MKHRIAARGAGGTVVARRVLAVATTRRQARSEGAGGPHMPLEELPGNHRPDRPGRLLRNPLPATTDTDAVLAATQGVTTT